MVAQSLSERVSRWLSIQRKKFFALALILIVLIGLWSGYTLWHQKRLLNDNQLLAALKTEAATWEEELNKLESEQQEAEELAAQKQEESQETAASENLDSADAPDTGAEQSQEGENALDDTSASDNVSDGSDVAQIPAEHAQETKEDFTAKMSQHNGLFASYLQQLIDGDSGDLPKVEALWWQAQLYEKQENLAKAQESLQRIYENYPSSLRAEQAQLRSAILAYQNGDVEKAVANFDELRASNSGIGLAALLQLGLINMQLKDYTKAREIFEETLDQLEGRIELESWNTLVRNQLIALDVLAANPS